MDLRQIPQKEALPRDIIILSNKNNYPKHAVMFDKVVNGDRSYIVRSCWI